MNSPDALIIHPSIRLIINKENKRQGGARNSGIGVANGEWITFVDSDDVWLNNNVLSTIDSYIRKNPSSKLIRSEKYVPVPYNFENQEYIIDSGTCSSRKVSFKDYYLSDDFKVHVWSTFVSAKMISENKLRFREHVVFEDTDFMIKLAYFAGLIDFIDFNYYGYCENPASVTRAPRLSMFRDNVSSIKATSDFFHAHPDLLEDNEIRLKFEKRQTQSALGFLKISRNYRLKDSYGVLIEARRQGLLNNGYNIAASTALAITRLSPIIPLAFIKMGVSLKRFAKAIIK